jgi:hypothetical protein
MLRVINYFWFQTIRLVIAIWVILPDVKYIIKFIPMAVVFLLEVFNGIIIVFMRLVDLITTILESPKC